MTFKGFFKAMLPVVVSVIVALFVIKWGDDNDVPVLTDVADLF
jgi:hypothetical protein